MEWKIGLLFAILGIGLIIQFYDAERDWNGAFDIGYENITTKEFYFKRNLKITFIQIVFSLVISLWLKYYRVNEMIILTCVVGVPFYIIAMKAGFKGYTDNIFDFVEAFSFSTVIVTSIAGMIGWLVILLSLIYIAIRFNDKYEKFNFWVNLFAVFEFGIMFLIDKAFNITSLSLYYIIIFILLPHTIIKALNVVVSYFLINRYSRN